MPQSQQGETNPSAKLTVDDIRVIRQRHVDGVSLRELADDYEVSHASIWMIVTRRTWRNVDP